MGEKVSMKSGLEGRNNAPEARSDQDGRAVSMKSGLEGRNNDVHASLAVGGLESQ